jgi:hypothetical protein
MFISTIYPLQNSIVLAYSEYLDFRNLVIIGRDKISLQDYGF